LTLDPTPSVEDTADDEFTWGNWWAYTRQGVTVFFKNFIVEYDADQQERTRNAVSQSNWWNFRWVRQFVFGPNGDNWLQASLLALAALAAAVAVWKMFRRPRTTVSLASEAAPSFYGRLLDTLKRKLGMAPRAGETAAEFAGAAGQRLGATPATHAVATVPTETAATYYRVRFGDRPLTDDERQALDASLTRLEAALTSPTPPR
jgi:hypothetical protein